jgi:hypothetical protein
MMEMPVSSAVSSDENTHEHVKRTDDTGGEAQAGVSFGIVLVALAAPNFGILPSLPPFPLISSIPIMWICLQMVSGSQEPKLPRMLNWLGRYMNPANLPQWIARWLSPPGPARHRGALNSTSLRFYGLAGICGALALSALPPGNILGGLGVLILGLGLARRDGRWAMLGMLLSFLSLLLCISLGLWWLSANAETCLPRFDCSPED